MSHEAAHLPNFVKKSKKVLSETAHLKHYKLLKQSLPQIFYLISSNEGGEGGGQEGALGSSSCSSDVSDL